MIDEAFQGRDVQKAALRNKTGKTAISIIDHKVRSVTAALSKINNPIFVILVVLR